MNFLNVIKKLVPVDTLNVAINLVKYSAIKFINNEERRQWVIKELMNTLHVKESIARIAVEIAVLVIKEKNNA